MINPWREFSKVNPQREKGRREISNECFQALIAARLPGAVYQIMLTVIDKTWGFNKKEGRISLSYFEKATGLSRQSVCQAIRQAEAMRLVVVERDSTKVSQYMFNKHWDTWLTSQANHTSEEGEELVNEITPDQSSKSHQTSQVNHTSTSQPPTPRTEPVKKHIKETSKETLKERATPPSEFEIELLRILKTFPGWQYQEPEDLAWLRELASDYENITPSNIKACRDYHSEKPVKKGPWKNRIRQWLIHEMQFRAENPEPDKDGKIKGLTIIGDDNYHHIGKPLDDPSDHSLKDSIGKPLDTIPSLRIIESGTPPKRDEPRKISGLEVVE